MLWILDRLVEKQLIKPMEACDKLKKLIQSNIVYQNNMELVAEMEKRLTLWR